MSDEFDSGDDGDDSEPNSREQNHFLDDLLAQHRPDRYDMDDTEDMKWLEPVIASAAKHLGTQDIQKVIATTAERLVKAREGQGNRKANKSFAKIFSTGQLPLGWGEEGWMEMYTDVLHQPLAITKKDRVRFGALTVPDIKQFLVTYKAKFKETEAAYKLVVKGAEWAIKQMEKTKAKRLDGMR